MRKAISLHHIVNGQLADRYGSCTARLEGSWETIVYLTVEAARAKGIDCTAEDVGAREDEEHDRDVITVHNEPFGIIL